MIHQTRYAASQFFNAANPAQMIMTLNATDGLNMAIKGMLQAGDHVITTCMEHNSVLRPLYSLQQAGQIEVTILKLQADGNIHPEQLAAAIRPNTTLAALNHASNVTGSLLDIDAMCAICNAQGVDVLLDASQTAGVLPIDVQKLNVAAMACSGHKSLLGPQGTGLLYVRPDIELAFWREGGTGSISHEVYQPDFMPDRMEAGTPNTPGIAGLGAALQHLSQIGIDKIQQHEMQLAARLRQGLRQDTGVTAYGPESGIGTVSINLQDFDAADLSVALERQYGILTRPGLHCAPLAHKAIGTTHKVRSASASAIRRPPMSRASYCRTHRVKPTGTLTCG